MVLRNSWIAAGCLLLASGCCGVGVRSCCEKEKSFQSSDSVSPPVKTTWTKARVHATCSTPVPNNSTDRPSRACEHVLVLQTHDGEKRVPLQTFGCDDSDQPCIKRIEAMRMQLSVAPDAHAIAFSTDGATWRVAGLDAGEPAVVCPEATFSATRATVWSAAFSTREIVLDILQHGKRWKHANEYVESKSAAAYVRSHPDDAGCRTALAEFLFGTSDKPVAASVDLNALSEHWELMSAAMGEAALRDSDVRKRMVELLPKCDKPEHHACCPQVWQVGALALSTIQAAWVQEAIGRAMADHDRIQGDSLCPDLAASWALARITSGLGTATPQVRELLIRRARAALPTPTNPNGVFLDSASSAVRALARLTDPEAAAVVGELAAVAHDCRDAPSALPAFGGYSVDYKGEWVGGTYNSSGWRGAAFCWAKVAQQKR